MVASISRWLTTLSASFLCGCGLMFTGLDIGLINDKDIPVRLLVGTKVIELNPKSIVVVSANATMRICENGMARDISIDYSEGSPYWKYLRNARVNIRINSDGNLQYASDLHKEGGDEVQLGLAFRGHPCP